LRKTWLEGKSVGRENSKNEQRFIHPEFPSHYVGQIYHFLGHVLNEVVAKVLTEDNS
jgi:hypothetical protein